MAQDMTEPYYAICRDGTLQSRVYSVGAASSPQSIPEFCSTEHAMAMRLWFRRFIANFPLNDDANLGQPFDNALRRRMTMKTMLRATILVFSIGIGSAFADDGDGYSATTLFTSIPGEQPSLTAAAPGRVATASLNGTVARGYVTTSRRSTWVFPPAQNGGEH